MQTLSEARASANAQPDNARRQDRRIVHISESAKQPPLVAGVNTGREGPPGARDFCPGLQDFPLPKCGR